MKVIANNLSFKNKEFIKAARSGDKAAMASMAESARKAGADIIGVSLSLDGDGDELYIKGAVEAVQKAGLPLAIDSRNPAAQFAAVKSARVPVIINYVSDEAAKSAAMGDILRIAADNGTDLVLYALRKGVPANTDERLEIISDLMEKANAAGVPNERLIIDPVILHIGGGTGQEEQALAVQRTLYGLQELVEPPLRTTCWLTNISTGMPGEVRPHINATFLAMLAGLGLWSAYMDVYDKEVMRTVRLVRALKNETVYSLADAA